MNERVRDETRTQEPEAERHSTQARKPGRPAFARGAELLKAGIRLRDIPPKDLLEISSRIGNSNFLELLDQQSGIDAAGPVPSPLAPGSHREPTRIRASPVQTVEPMIPAVSPVSMEPFPVSCLRERGVYGADSTPLIMEGAAGGAISD